MKRRSCGGIYRLFTLVVGAAAIGASASGAGPYPDGRPHTEWRIDASDEGRVIRHGTRPDQCDLYGAREAIVFSDGDKHFLYYDGAGPTGWLACLAVSNDLRQWRQLGPVLDLGPKRSSDSAAAASPWVYRDGPTWHMFYLGTPNALPAPERVPRLPT